MNLVDALNTDADADGAAEQFIGTLRRRCKLQKEIDDDQVDFELFIRMLGC